MKINQISLPAALRSRRFYSFCVKMQGLILGWIIVAASASSFAQGWTFSAEAYTSGNCAYLTTPNLVPADAIFPTRADCEATRSYLQSFSTSTGGCSVTIKCTPCQGSDLDMGSAGAEAPGAVPENARAEGRPALTTHTSKAYDDWASDYVQTLRSYGIESILGKRIKPNSKTPPTAKKPSPPAPPKAKDVYDRDRGSFNPSDPNVVNIGKDRAVVGLLTTQAEQAQRDAFQRTRLEQNYSGYQPVSEEQGIQDYDGPGKGVTALVRTVTETFGGAAPSFTLGVCDDVLGGSLNALDQLKQQDAEGAAETGSNLAFNAVRDNTAKVSADALTSTFGGPILKAVKGATTVYNVIKFGSDYKENYDKP